MCPISCEDMAKAVSTYVLIVETIDHVLTVTCRCTILPDTVSLKSSVFKLPSYVPSGEIDRSDVIQLNPRNIIMIPALPICRQ